MYPYPQFFLLLYLCLGALGQNAPVNAQGSADASGARASNYTRFADRNYAVGSPQEQLQLDVYVPTGGQPSKPVMVYVHGGSWRLGDKANTRDKDEFFTQLDYVFVSVNYRLSPNPINIDDPDRVKFPDHPQDIARAIRWVVDSITHYGGDPERLSLLGHSAGAHLVALVATDAGYLQAEGLDLDRIKCTCALDAGAYDIPYYIDTYAGPGSNQWFNYVNAFGDDPADWAAASPSEHLAPDKNIPHFLIVHQGTLRRIDIAQRFGEGLAENDIPQELFNAFPFNHEEINTLLGSTVPQVQAYNDRIAQFFTDCLAADRLNTALQAPEPLPLQISPNPTAGSVRLEWNPTFDPTAGTLQIYNAAGILLDTVRPQGFPLDYDFGAYPSGWYWISLRVGEARVLQPLLRE